MNHKDASYAILSHTWENGEEVSYGEFRSRGARRKRGPRKRGWQKIEKTCQLALDNGCDFAWVDTCCIDKTSSAELTEAINSMFPWYADSIICYTYLSDFDSSDPDAEMSHSRWFTRGWTLQELIAPARVHFYDKSWNSIGTKDVLSDLLSLITGIGPEVLLASEHRNVEETVYQMPIARKMSWAAKRETTRIEDMAYCLLGIFGVNLPLLYGEGKRAFVRLQEEIIKNSNDLSLLAWSSPKVQTTINLDRYSGVFAQHPQDFQDSGNLAVINDVKFIPDFTMTNKGLKIHTQLCYDHSAKLHVLEINCHDLVCPQEPLGIFLIHQGASVFARARPHLFASTTNVGSPEVRSFFLSKSITPSMAKPQQEIYRQSFHARRFENPLNINHPVYFLAAKPEALWDNANEMFITFGLQDFVGCHEYSYQEGVFIVVFGFGYGSAPWVRILPSHKKIAIIKKNHFELLHDQVNRGAWREVAQTAISKTSEDLYVGELVIPPKYNRDARRVYVSAELEEGIKGGETVYSIRTTYVPRE